MQEDDDDMVFTVPERQSRLSVDFEAASTLGIDSVEAINIEDARMGKRQAQKLRGYTLGTLRWEYKINCDVCLLKANRFWVVAACFDGTVVVLSSLSGFLRFIFTLDSAPCSVTLDNFYLSVITGYGFIYVWNLEEGKVILSKKSCLDPFSQEDSLEKHLITPTGIPVLHLSSGKSFAFSSGCWQLLGDAHSFIARISSFAPKPVSSLDSNLLYLFEPLRSETLLVDPVVKASATCSLMEERLHAASIFQYENEYRSFLDVYIRWLVENNVFDKLENVVSSLEGQKNWFGSLTKKEVLTIVENARSRFDA